MESVTYKSEVSFALDAIKDKAQSAGYQVEYKHIKNLIFLDITVALLPYLKQWQWNEAGEATLRILAEFNPERMAQHPSGSVYIIHFTPSTISGLAQFLKPLLLKYGGWIGLDDEMEVVYDSGNIDTITENSFFAEMY